MCQKCHYKVRKSLAGIVGQEPNNCIIQLFKNSKDETRKQIASFIVKRIVSGSDKEHIIIRIRENIERAGIDDNTREAYQYALAALTGASQDTKDHEEDIYGGVFNG